ncbi:MAG TPA: hypothetical protein VIB47_14110 [Dehalococcoidia bacterium]|jgi:hypothetical protein
MAKPISEQLTDLSARAKDAEDSFEATKTAGTEMVHKREEEIQVASAKRRERSRQEYLKAQESMASVWSGLSSKLQSDIDGIRAKIDVKKQEHDHEKAARAADQAEENAMFAIDFAYSAVDYAETAALDAVLARERAASV